MPLWKPLEMPQTLQPCSTVSPMWRKVPGAPRQRHSCPSEPLAPIAFSFGQHRARHRMHTGLQVSAFIPRSLTLPNSLSQVSADAFGVPFPKSQRSQL